MNIEITINKEDFKRKLGLKDGKDGEAPTKDELLNLIKPFIPPPLKGERGKDADIDFLMKKIDDRFAEITDTLKKSQGMRGMRRIPIVKRVNLTSQVDGSTRAFSLPRDTVEVLGVWSTQFPITFDTADWTFAGNTLTLATGITTPASGQTLFCLVETLFY